MALKTTQVSVLWVFSPWQKLSHPFVFPKVSSQAGDQPNASLKWRLSACSLTPQRIVGLLPICHLLTSFICLGRLGDAVWSTRRRRLYRLLVLLAIYFLVLVVQKGQCVSYPNRASSLTTHQNVIWGLSLPGLFLACSEHQQVPFQQELWKVYSPYVYMLQPEIRMGLQS